ncbi:MAG TPA: SpoIIE family protein phosphatase, partial [Ilumatobacteraceae bacterium]
DGVSRHGTLGIGLGAIRRIANRFDIHSVPGRGSIFAVTFAQDRKLVPAAHLIDGISRPITGEIVCGDAWAYRVDGRRVAVLVADGLGHGQLAANAANTAVEVFGRDPWLGPSEVLQSAHRAMGATRGAAAAAVDIDLESGALRFAGVGNIAARIVGAERANGLISQPGIVGQQMRNVREITLTMSRGLVLILHSDGLTSKWEPQSIPHLTSQPTDIMCAALLREAGLRQDDATVVALRVP